MVNEYQGLSFQAILLIMFPTTTGRQRDINRSKWHCSRKDGRKDAGIRYQVNGKRTAEKLGTLVENVGKVQSSNSVAENEIYNASPILCVVFAFSPQLSKPKKFEQWFISPEIDALIHRGEMRPRWSDVDAEERALSASNYIKAFLYGEDNQFEEESAKEGKQVDRNDEEAKKVDPSQFESLRATAI
ncbi:hypothetical protein NE237_001567 [Protea cynaroides]|uniref:Uncharacterized protein n=1 Tax=Protea cynaroides TaxID=273540 RepID=A0A9Q0KUE5_9MAGN|nr:hypothetical protein NE237_001567 [Protea cynaroides]